MRTAIMMAALLIIGQLTAMSGKSLNLTLGGGLLIAGMLFLFVWADILEFVNNLKKRG